MSDEMTGRFTGMRPMSLDRVIQQFLTNKKYSLTDRDEIQKWISSGAVDIDGSTTRSPDKLVAPGSFLKIRLPG